uniref:Uncharacterized protein n=1 Tax=Accipiter nisus TaxID=211598 RepID=A0A8B9MPX7_9AVES
MTDYAPLSGLQFYNAMHFTKGSNSTASVRLTWREIPWKEKWEEKCSWAQKPSEQIDLGASDAEPRQVSCVQWLHNTSVPSIQVPKQSHNVSG